jgi:hypothetical protein
MIRKERTMFTSIRHFNRARLWKYFHSLWHTVFFGSIVLYLQACGCKHYPFELLRSEVGDPLHAQITAYRTQTGHYPDGQTVGAYLQAMGCQYRLGTHRYPNGHWQCGDHLYTMTYWHCETAGTCNENSVLKSWFMVELEALTSCSYNYTGKEFNRYEDISCVHAECVSKYLH